MAIQKINIELEVESENTNGLNDTELEYVKEAVRRTIYEYDNFTSDILAEEYNLPEVYVYGFDENDNANTTEEKEETEE